MVVLWPASGWFPNLLTGINQTSTLIAGVRLHGAMDGEMFLAWVRQGLVAVPQAGDLVIMDNLAMHQVVGVRESIEADGARLLYLPPYSPASTPSKTCGAMSSRRCAGSLRASSQNCWPPQT